MFFTFVKIKKLFLNKDETQIPIKFKPKLSAGRKGSKKSWIKEDYTVEEMLKFSDDDHFPKKAFKIGLLIVLTFLLMD